MIITGNIGNIDIKKTFFDAFRHSLPVMFGFFPLGIAYGILMQSSGYNALWTGACSTFVLGGSLQFLMVNFFGSSVPILTAALLALLVNSRHVFYGISYIDKFRSFGGLARWFLIFSLTDEAYSLHCSHYIVPGVNEKWAYVLTSGFVMFYWVLFSVIGAAVGSLITFDTTGIDFSLTALFAVITIDSIRGAEKKYPAAIAAVSSAASLFAFGADNFILPSLIITIASLIICQKIGEAKES